MKFEYQPELRRVLALSQLGTLAMTGDEFRQVMKDAAGTMVEMIKVESGVSPEQMQAVINNVQGFAEREAERVLPKNADVKPCGMAGVGLEIEGGKGFLVTETQEGFDYYELSIEQLFQMANAAQAMGEKLYAEQTARQVAQMKAKCEARQPLP